MKRINIFLNILFCPYLILYGQDTNEQNSYFEGKTLIELVKEQRPSKLLNIRFGRGTLYSLHWEGIEFILHEYPDYKSQVLLKKDAHSNTVFIGNNNREFCKFSQSTNENNCHEFLKISDIDDPPPYYYIYYVDFHASKKYVWYKIKFGSFIGWVRTPYKYSSDDSQYLTFSRKYLYSTPYTFWKPLKGLLYFDSIESNDSKAIKELLSLDDSLRIVVYEQIFWQDDDPFLKVAIAKKLTWEEWCGQTKKPEIIKTVFIRMFNEKNELNIIRQQEPNCD